jgi:hypothetical protein
MKHKLSITFLVASLLTSPAAVAQSPQPAGPAAPLGTGFTYQAAGNLEYVGHIGGPTNAVAVQGAYAYIGEGPALTVLDVSTPGSPSVLGKTTPMPAIVEGVAVAGGYAYVAANDAGLRVIDVSDAARPTEVGSLGTWGPAYGVAATGTYAYVADDAGLLVVDVSTPSTPSASRIYLPGHAYDVAVAGGYAHVADWDAGLRVVSVSTPWSPAEVGFYDTPGWA